MRSSLGNRVATASNEEGAGQCRCPSVDVDDGAAGEVKRLELEQPAVSVPDPVAKRRVDDGDPEDGENQQRLERDALDERAGDQRRRDDREHHLEDHEGQAVGRWLKPAQTKVGQIADKPADVRAEGQGIAHMIQTTVATPAMTNDCMIVAAADLVRTKPE